MKKRIFSYIGILLVTALALAVPALAANDVKAEIPVEIKLEGPVLSSVDTFTVELKAVTDGAPLPTGGSAGVYTEEIKGAGKATLSITYTELGVYSYTLHEVKGSSSYITYDTEEYSVTVYVTNNESGEREVTVVIKDSKGNKVDTALFTNKYADPEPAKLDPPIAKAVTVKNGTAPKDSVFTFAMVPSDKTAPMPDNSEAKLDTATGTLTIEKKGPGSYEFGWMTFDVDDIGKTYTYTLKEIPGKDSKYTYDINSYTMTVKVTEKDRKIVLEVTYTDANGKTVETITFTNVYDAGTTPNTPQTGDNSHLILWGALFAVAAAGLGTALFMKKKTKQ